jgi:hypothetical protein
MMRWNASIVTLLRYRIGPAVLSSIAAGLLLLSANKSVIRFISSSAKSNIVFLHHFVVVDVVDLLLYD